MKVYIESDMKKNMTSIRARAAVQAGVSRPAAARAAGALYAAQTGGPSSAAAVDNAQRWRTPVGDAERWRALKARDQRADGAFLYGVVTTGVYCRPSCASRAPKRDNVIFFESAGEAERAGYRPCKRCEPDLAPSQQWHAKAIVRACRAIEETEGQLSLNELAARVGMSPYHFSRIFKKTTGVTPKEYANGKRAQRLVENLRGGRSVTQAIYDAGYGSPSRFYESDIKRLGMMPANYKTGGAGLKIDYALRETSLGWLLVAAVKHDGKNNAAGDPKRGKSAGVCAIEFGNEPEELSKRLQMRFPGARLEKDETGFAEWVERLASYVEMPLGVLSLPLDIRGTAFQERVWRELRKIPPGATASYGEIARRLKSPKAARAVARACAANPAAIAVPCHRAVRGDGGMGGYRWGVQRKRAMLERESRENPLSRGVDRKHT
jgi:AraC family transcriptional regulator of adaptative response/methylated-DNA-[protein]-cysteine methyltransferase